MEMFGKGLAYVESRGTTCAETVEGTMRVGDGGMVAMGRDGVGVMEVARSTVGNVPAVEESVAMD